MELREWKNLFLIFDMDGVVVDSNPFHKMAWKAFCERHRCHLTDDKLQHDVYGKTNEDALHYLFKNELDSERIKQFAKQKEQIYRKLFKAHLAPVSGLVEFLEKAKNTFAGIALATSAPPENVNFVLDTLNLRQFFQVIVDENMVSKGKPDPEIYLETAKRLNADPKQCIVFEDSLSGIQAAKVQE